MKFRLDPLLALALLLLLGLAGFVGLSAIGSWDIWWHLKTGELAWLRKSALPFDEFSLTQAGDPWVYKDLGADILFYFIHHFGGEAGLVVFKLAAAIAVLALVLGLVSQRVPISGWVVLFGGLAFAIASFRIIVRPEAFSLIFFPILLLLIERHRSQSNVGWRRYNPLIAAVLLLWLWANCHRGAALGLVVFWGYAGLELIAGFCAEMRFRPFWLRFTRSGSEEMPIVSGAIVVAFAGAAVGAMMLNPSGVILIEQTLEVTSSDALESLISEWNRLTLSQLWADFPLTVVWVIALWALVPTALLLSSGDRRKVDLWDVGVVVFFSVVAIQTPRLHPFLAIATAPTLAASCSTLWTRLTTSTTAFRALRRALPMVAAGLVWAVVFATGRAGIPEPGWAEDRYPEGAVELIETGQVVGEGFSTYTFAGYVIYHLWPNQHVLCDGRFDTVYSDHTIQLCLAASNHPEIFRYFVSEYRLEWVLNHNRPGASRNPDLPANFDYLDVDPDWALVHWDAASLLYVRWDGPNRGIAEERGYQYLRPHDPDVSLMSALFQSRDDPALLNALEDEVLRLVDAAPSDYRVVILYALWLHETHQTEGAEYLIVLRTLRAMRDLDPPAIDQVLDYLTNPR